MFSILHGSLYSLVARQSLLPRIARLKAKSRPRLVAFLAKENDVAAEQYIKSTQRLTEQLQLQFTLQRCDARTLKNHILAANKSPHVDGILVYYPVFGRGKGEENDVFLQSIVAKEKDVEGLSSYHRRGLLADGPLAPDVLLPCTAQAILYLLGHLDATRSNNAVTLINRSDQVGRPLAALLARQGYLVDAFGLKEMETWAFTKDTFQRSLHPLSETVQYKSSMQQAGTVITGVPDPHFRLPLDLLPVHAHVIDFASPCRNVDEEALMAKTDWSGTLVRRIGKITSLMLMHNLIKCCELRS